MLIALGDLVCPKNAQAYDVNSRVAGLRFKPEDFEKVAPGRDGWSALRESDWMADNDAAVRKFLAQPTAPSTQTSAVAIAEDDLTNASDAAAMIEGMLGAIRKWEAERKAELRAAKLAQAQAE